VTGSAETALVRLLAASESAGFAGYDPYDALSSPAIARLARTRLLRGAAIQALKRAPFNPRPLLGVPRQEHTKALALFASACAVYAREPGAERYGDAARELAERLLRRAVSAGGGIAWGYDFDVQTRWAYYRRGQPNAVATAFAVNALLDVADLDGAGHLRDAARSALDFVGSTLLVERGGEAYFAYFAGSDTPIHNASLLLSALFARHGEASAPQRAAAERAVSYSLERQRPDGSWPYGEGERLGWVDGFHTAYVLDSLLTWDEHADVPGAREALEGGLALYIERLFDPDGAPRATIESRYPIDIHAASSAIGTLSRLEARDPRAVPTAERVLRWTLEEMSRPDGRFAFQRHRRIKNAVPYVRWSDGHMALALARYVTREGSAADRGERDSWVRA
jgi:hypothetical protein